MTVLEKNQKLLRESAAITGRTLKEDGTVVNLADLLDNMINEAGLVDSLMHGTNAAGDAEAIDVVSGAMRVKDDQIPLHTPARDILIGWPIGADDVTETLVADTEHVSLPVEIGYMNPNMRNLVVQTDAAATSAYEVYFSRNIDTGNDNALVASGTITAAGSPNGLTNIPLPASLGYDVYCIVKITPDVGDVTTQLEYKMYLIGRGG